MPSVGCQRARRTIIPVTIRFPYRLAGRYLRVMCRRMRHRTPFGHCDAHRPQPDERTRPAGEQCMSRTGTAASGTKSCFNGGMRFVRSTTRQVSRSAGGRIARSETDGPGDATRRPWRTSGSMLRNIRAFPSVLIYLMKFGYHR